MTAMPLTVTRWRCFLHYADLRIMPTWRAEPLELLRFALARSA
jgi:hypothetical protein